METNGRRKSSDIWYTAEWIKRPIPCFPTILWRALQCVAMRCYDGKLRPRIGVANAHRLSGNAYFIWINYCMYKYPLMVWPIIIIPPKIARWRYGYSIQLQIFLMGFTAILAIESCLMIMKAFLAFDTNPGCVLILIYDLKKFRLPHLHT